MQTAKNAAAHAATSPAHHGRTSTGTTARAASAKGRPPPERGSSKRSQSTAITNAATPESTKVLSIRSLRDERSLERCREVVAGAHDSDGNPHRVQSQQQRLRAAL